MEVDSDKRTLQNCGTGQSVKISDFPSKTKPSYLNIACCVSGYSSITSYDSKLRQDINKSREVSPIRPSTASIKFCKRSNVIPHVTMDESRHNNTISSLSVNLKYMESNNNNHDNITKKNENSAMHSSDKVNHGNKSTSFIQQRVERLYGPAALAQGFYSPKKNKSKSRNDCLNISERTEFDNLVLQSSPLLFTDKQEESIHHHNVENNTLDLPVLRHLSLEFRAQLPSISPKRNYTKNTSTNQNALLNESLVKIQNSDNISTNEDIVDHTVVIKDDHDIEMKHTSEINCCDNTEIATIGDLVKCEIISSNEKGNNGNYYLNLLKNEQNRILELANLSDKYISSISNDSETSEEILGILRSASGKARLLVTQKMKQFEGLCHNNLNRSPEDKFPTTVEDLQGFWDMVHLQIDDINAIYEEVEVLRKNEWKELKKEESSVGPLKKQQNIKSNTIKIKAAPSKTPTTNPTTLAAVLRRENQRKQFLELKRKHKLASADTTDSSLSDKTSLI